MNKHLNRNNSNKAYFRAAARLSAVLQLQGHAAYWVGGAVRDMFLKQPISDIDIATSASPEEIKKVVAGLGMKFITIGEKFGTIAVICQKSTIQITTFRSEKGYTDRRHPDNIKFIAAVKLDAMRRDLTINALYYDPKAKTILDFCDGRKDLRAKKIKFIGNADQRIKEDPLRMMRAVRFACVLDFTIEKKDAAAIKRNSKLIALVSGERIKSELDKIISSDRAIEGVSLLGNLGLLKIILPELERMKSVKQSRNYHAEGNVFVHVFKAFSNLVKDDETAFRYAVLFHDLGKFGISKPITREGRKHISFPGHSQNGSKIFKTIARRLRFSAADAKYISYLIQHHMDLHHMPKKSDEALYKFIQKPYADDLLRLRFADKRGSIRTDHSGKVIKSDFGELQSVAKRLIKFKERISKPFLRGGDVKKYLGLQQGQEIGKILKRMLFFQATGRVKNRKQAISTLKNLKLS
jgi:tRNA nucleotidyltransferase/poly(A) polymerase